MTDRWFLIVNPKAGGGCALLDFPHISKLLHDSGIVCDTHFTEHKYQAVEYTVRAVNQGYRKIIVVGGGGTLHEVANGLFIQQQVDPRQVKIGVIGVGFDNGWLRTFGFEQRGYQDMVQAIKDGHTMLQDVGVVNYEESHYRQSRYMVCAGGTGFDAEVAKRYNHRRMKYRRRRWSYLRCVVRTFFRYKHTGVRIYLDDKLIYNNLLFSAAIGICKYNIGGVQQLPDAVVDDGLLDVTLIRPIHFWHILFRILYLFNGKIYKIGHVERHRGERIRIESTPDMKIEVDGELLGTTPIEFTLLKQALQVVVSSHYLENRAIDQ